MRWQVQQERVRVKEEQKRKLEEAKVGTEGEST